MAGLAVVALDSMEAGQGPGQAEVGRELLLPGWAKLG